MPAPWAAGFRVRVLGKIHGQDTVTVMHFATNTVINDPQTLNQLLKDLANAVKECITDTLLPALSQDWAFHNVEAFRIYPDISDPLSADDLVVVNGTGGTQGVTVASQLVQLRTGLGGRSGRGRWFLPPTGEDRATAGQWTAPALLALAAFCACMAGKFVGAGASENFRLGVLSQKKVNNALPPFDNRFREVNTLTPVADIAYMTSRKLNRGS